ncbi:MAG: TetR/AcrR family transcriptional regulator [Clostridiaceae bacterium]|jgi:hypothetical protein|nr:TetR-like C-terminal domain-containing protein [Bacillota bacterium]NLN51664.1 TetR/AcrR family transcriptional regulator [Clostridiaceae bacterium]
MTNNNIFLNTYEDPRTLRTKKALHKSLSNKLKYKKLKQISVSEITDQANINRSTFYLHYSNLDDLYLEIEEYLYEQYQEKLKEFQAKIDFMKIDQQSLETEEAELLKQTFAFLQINKEYSAVILEESSANSFLNKIVKQGEKVYLLKQKTKLAPSDKVETKYSYTFTSNGLVAVIKQWLADGMIESPEEMSKLAYKLLYL